MTEAKRIYQSQQVANMICGKLRKADPDSKIEVVPVNGLFQIVRIKKLPDYVPPRKPKPVEKPLNALLQEIAPNLNQSFKSDQEVITADEMMILKFQFKADRPKNVILVRAADGANGQAGTDYWLSKSHIIAYEVDGDIVRVKLPKKVAAKKELATIAVA